MILRKISQFILCGISLLSLTTGPAYAYLDPGTGSMILQATIAAVALGLATIKSWWYRVTALFGSKKGPGEDEQEQIADKSEPAQPEK